jgi:hypothetical protein
LKAVSEMASTSFRPEIKATTYTPLLPNSAFSQAAQNITSANMAPKPSQLHFGRVAQLQLRLRLAVIVLAQLPQGGAQAAQQAGQQYPCSRRQNAGLYHGGQHHQAYKQHQIGQQDDRRAQIERQRVGARLAGVDQAGGGGETSPPRMPSKGPPTRWPSNFTAR